MGAECYNHQCGECGSFDVVTDFGAGDVVCRSCGMILGERIIDDSPEWRNFANDDRGGDPAAKSRVGEAADHRLDSVSLSSYLVDASRSKGADDGGLSVKRPNINQESAQVRRMVNSMDRIKELAADMGLTKGVLEMALDIYAEAERKEISMRGPEKDSVPVAILFIACRKNGHSRSLKEFEAASGVAKKRIGKTFLSLTRSMEIDMCQASTEEYVARFCSKLGLPHKTQHIANDVAKKADTLGLSTGKSPIAMAASVIYLVAAYTNAKRSIQEISNVTMIGEKNMKVVCKELNKSRVVLFEGVLLT